jgi:flagellar hook-basal body complex protein FliE
MPISTDNILQLARTNSLQYTANGRSGVQALSKDAVQGVLDAAGLRSGAEASSVDDPSSFGNAMLKALDGVNADQQKSNDLVEQMLVDPDSVDAHEITIGMAEASLSLNLAKTLLSRVVTAWKDVINTR